MSFSKKNLQQIGSSKKTATVESAFDSDESDWSDEDGGTAPVQQQEKVHKGFPKSSDSQERDDTEEAFQSRRQSYATASNGTENSPSSRRKSFTRKTQEQQPLSSSPYFEKESNATTRFQVQENSNIPINGDNGGKVKDLREDESDDWDEDSCMTKPHEEVVNVKGKNENLFFQPSSSVKMQQSKKRVSVDKTKHDAVDWSETYSEGGGSIKDLEFENIENLPVDEQNLVTDGSHNKRNSFSVKADPVEESATANKHEIFTTVSSEKYLVDSSTPNRSLVESNGSINDNQNLKSKDNSIVGNHASPAFTVSPMKSLPFTVGSSANLDSYVEMSQEDMTKNASFNTLPSSSSAAKLFCVAPASPASGHLEKSSSSDLNLTASNPNLLEASKTKKGQKPSSAKKLLTRFFSSDDKLNKSVDEGKVRKTSEPIPLSTLLLNTPVATPTSQSDNEIQKKTIQTPSSQHNLDSSSSTHQSILPTRYFPPDSAGKPEDSQVQSVDFIPIPKKHKGFIGKMKRTLGISSKGKGSKMKTSESLKNIPSSTTAAAGKEHVASDPCIPTGSHIITNRQTPISVETTGRNAEEVIAELLHQGKAYLESTANSYSIDHGGEGDVGGASQNRKSTSQIADTDKFKKSSFMDILAGKSTSGNSLVDDEHVGPGESGQEKMSSHLKSNFYCSQAKPHCPNRQVIYNLIEDFCCVLDKSFGEQDKLKNDNGNLFTEIDQLRVTLDCCEACKAELERRIQELQAELQKLQFCLEEECQARANLEGIVCELKSQLDRQDEILNCLLAEKSDLVAAIKRLETDNFTLKNQISDFGGEREEYTRSYRGFEITRNKCGELQQALAECCEKHDLLQREILELRNENNEIKLKLDNCVFEKNKAINDILQNEVLGLRTENNETRMKLDACEFEKNRLLNEMESMKQAFAAEKTNLEAKICELLDGIANLEKTKAEVCKQTNSMLAAHHEEMDNLKTEAETWRVKFEQEARLREDTEARLRATEDSVKATTFRSSIVAPTSLPITARTQRYESYQRTISSEPGSLSSASYLASSRDILRK